jgi:hypothetical protein
VRRVQARLNQTMDALTPPEHVKAMKRHGQKLDFEHTGPLPELLRWLADLPIADVKIEPLGLANIYHQYHSASD